ncbi:hypothetical protein DVH05_017085 [Phytophthora capsici]|nr:hypothetical protein DVH05_017085 [Phytophthora capsici]|eukprot:jgi/Phyca11/20886/fgenesh1_pg.PHYCAscaffold_75_\
MLGFFVLVKHIREHSKFFMLQFKSLYRPDDHQNTQKRIILGNIAPCMFTLMFFKWLTAVERALTFILVFITGVGDGLAEHARVFLSGLVFHALHLAAFDNFWLALLLMLILLRTMAYAEAEASHTMDTPLRMIGCGVILYAIVDLVESAVIPISEERL